MNLIYDPFIPVLMRDKTHRLVSLEQVFEEAEDIFTIDGAMHQRATVVSLLAGITQAAIGSFDQAEWNGIRQNIISASLKYLSSRKDRFDLGGKHPFLQYPGLKSSIRYRPTNNLCIEHAVGDMTTFFEHDAASFQPNDGEKAMGLLVCQLFRQNSLYQQLDMWTGEVQTACKPSPLTNQLVVVTEGECLLDTIWFHVFPSIFMGNLKVDKPFWDRTFKTRKDYEDYRQNSYFGTLLPVPFSFILRDDGMISESETLHVGKGEESPWAVRHPMLIQLPAVKEKDDSKKKSSRKSKAKEKVKGNIEYAKLRDGVEGWRQLGSALVAIDKDRSRFAWAIKQATLIPEKNIYLYTGGVGCVKDGISSFPESVFCIERGMREAGVQGWFDAYVRQYQVAKKYCEILHKGLYIYIKALSRSDQAESIKELVKKSRENAERMFWAGLSNYRAELLDAAEEDLGKRERWEKRCWKESRRVYDLNTNLDRSLAAEAYGRGISAWEGK